MLRVDLFIFCCRHVCVLNIVEVKLFIVGKVPGLDY